MMTEPEDDDEMLSFDDAFAIASKVVEMADRVKLMHMAIPGAQATWFFETDDTRFKVIVTVADPE